MPESRLPDDSQRIVIVGRTGSGKTLSALFHLSNRDLTAMPWIILDYKRDENIASIKRARQIDFDEVPKRPGVYILRPTVGQEDDVNNYMWKMLDKERMGLYVDEGFMLGKSKGFDAIQTQGRSKRIPVIALSQRPSWISRFVFSEADFFQIYHLNDKRDRETINAFTPPLDFGSDALPAYHSHYYDVGRHNLVKLAPVPRAEDSVDKIDRQLKRLRRII